MKEQHQLKLWHHMLKSSHATWACHQLSESCIGIDYAISSLNHIVTFPFGINSIDQRMKSQHAITSLNKIVHCHPEINSCHRIMSSIREMSSRHQTIKSNQDVNSLTQIMKSISSRQSWSQVRFRRCNSVGQGHARVIWGLCSIMIVAIALMGGPPLSLLAPHPLACDFCFGIL